MFEKISFFLTRSAALIPRSKSVPPHLVLGSAPTPQLPTKQFDSLALVCVNGSGWPAKQLGLPIPDLTVMSGGTLTLPQEEKTRTCLRGLRTKNLLVLTVGVESTQAKNILRELNYTYEQIAYMSYDKRARVIKAVTARNLGRGNKEKSKISNGLFAACLAFYRGAPEVILAGISLSSDGRAYSTGLDKRYHVKPDGDAIHALHQRKLRLYTSEPNLAQLCGIELV
ncbi:MAG TPA: hypothetical protein VKK81_04675 [Candidatus Binatia bacterium]|nr:hypothetical protein [Candidatus Binatia bacterium]